MRFHLNHPQLRGNYGPINFEASYDDIVIEGTVPSDLSGRLSDRSKPQICRGDLPRFWYRHGACISRGPRESGLCESLGKNAKVSKKKSSQGEASVSTSISIGNGPNREQSS